MPGVAKDAGQRATKDAFRSLALKYHPDRNREPGTEERFKEIAEAYAVLSDPKKRAEYDARGFPGVQGFSKEDLFSGINFDDLFSGLNFDFSGASPFERFFYPGRSEEPVQGENIEVELFIPLERVASGGRASAAESPGSMPCMPWYGHGGGVAPKTCTACNGTGRVTRSTRKEKEHILFQRVSICPACDGRGSMIEHPCPECQGRGSVEQEESFTVTIPPGIEEGMALRIPGKGMASLERCCASGGRVCRNSGATAMVSYICALRWRSRRILRVRNGIYTSVCVR